MSPNPCHPKLSAPIVVHRPHATDGLGHALRNVYARDRGVPEDMARLLAALDGRGAGSA